MTMSGNAGENGRNPSERDSRLHVPVIAADGYRRESDRIATVTKMPLPREEIVQHE